MKRRDRLTPREQAARMVRIYRRAQERIGTAEAHGKSIPPEAVDSMRNAKRALYDIERKHPAREWLAEPPPTDGGVRYA